MSDSGRVIERGYQLLPVVVLLGGDATHFRMMCQVVAQRGDAVFGQYDVTVEEAQEFSFCKVRPQHVSGTEAGVLSAFNDADIRRVDSLAQCLQVCLGTVVVHHKYFVWHLWRMCQDGLDASQGQEVGVVIKYNE